MDDLVAFSRAYDLVLWLVPAVERFPRRQRHALGERAELSALAVLEHVIAARSGFGRRESLRAASVELDKLRALMRVALDLKLLPPRGHEQFAVRCDEVGRLLGGWLRSCGAGGRPRPADGPGGRPDCGGPSPGGAPRPSTSHGGGATPAASSHRPDGTGGGAP